VESLGGGYQAFKYFKWTPSVDMGEKGVQINDLDEAKEMEYDGKLQLKGKTVLGLENCMDIDEGEDEDDDQRWCSVWEKAWEERTAFLDEHLGVHCRMIKCSRYNPSTFVSITGTLCKE
jgi:hypothetical protein